MLDKQSQKTLKYLISIADEYNSITNCANICAPGYSASQTLDSIRYLNDEGFIKVGYAWGQAPTSITINYRGLHNQNFKWAEFKSFLFRSFFVPVLVSFFTTLITYFLFQQ